MQKPFKRIAIYGQPRSYDRHDFNEALQGLKKFLQKLNVDLFIEKETAGLLKDQDHPIVELDQLRKCCDLLIVVGGDGNMLSAGRIAAAIDIPVVGINRGRLGFLTDILPSELENKLRNILEGHYQEEKRFLLSASVQSDNTVLSKSDALNDVVLLASKVAHMIQFEIFINQQLVLNQRADGLIIATPTGSTAYALSGGGPILHPELDVIVLVPVSPHTLSSRPIVVDANSEITIKLNPTQITPACLSCDGQAPIALDSDHHIVIRKKSEKLRLIHPLDYNYYETLRSKLGWQAKYGA
ncbi:MAG: NAD(+) kinase [Proteobacteria bacterium]|nr:NAD(+) kinase [Pseudomonadota bacterium]